LPVAGHILGATSRLTAGVVEVLAQPTSPRCVTSTLHPLPSRSIAPTTPYIDLYVIF
jgi:hypothetical protein